VKDTLLKESNEHDALRVTVQLVYDDLKLAPEQETSSLMTRAIRIVDRAHEIMRHVLYFGVQRSFMIARSHYENIDLLTMSQGFAPGYTQAELEEIEETVAPLAQDLARKIEVEVIPLRG
jgi:hypothetical protein